MGKCRSNFTVIQNGPGAVVLRDHCLSKQTMSITNDAENVTEWVHKNYGNKQVFYFDTEGVLTELKHNGKGMFTGFAEPETLPEYAY